MKVLINGICGYMGKEVERLCLSGFRGAEAVCGVDPSFTEGAKTTVYTTLDAVPKGEQINCIIDFSHHCCVISLLEFATENNIPTVVCTTGHTEEELEAISEAAKHIPVFFSANMSLGVALLVELAKKAAAAMPEADIEIVEKHHNRKLDAPSGTALMLARELAEVRPDSETVCGRNGKHKREPNEIGIHAIRMGNIVGEHEVIIGTDSQTITLKHEAHSRSLFAEGAIAAAVFLVGKEAGLYDMKSLIVNKEPASV